MTETEEARPLFRAAKNRPEQLTALVSRKDLSREGLKALLTLILYADRDLRVKGIGRLELARLFLMAEPGWTRGTKELVAKGIVSRSRGQATSYTYIIHPDGV